MHRTIHEHNIQRQDFERLCSNHTIKQYDVDYENTRKRLSGKPGADTLPFLNKKIKLEFGDTLKLNKSTGKISMITLWRVIFVEFTYAFHHDTATLKYHVIQIMMVVLLQWALILKHIRLENFIK